jgi:4-hydroxybenzoate polyprenyltransferase
MTNLSWAVKATPVVSSTEVRFAENAMITHPTEPIVHQKQGLVALHPKVYHFLGAMAVLFILAAWTFFDHFQYGFVPVAVTLFILFAIGIVADIAHIWHDHHDASEDPGEPTVSFPEWLESEVHIQRGTVSGKHAAVMAALPIAAGGIGMALLAVAHLIAVG